MDTKRILKVGGVKVEVDLREAKQITSYRVGDAVKILRKEYSSWTESVGVIVGFTPFATHPCIEILCVKNVSYANDVEFLTITEDTPDIELAPLSDFQAAFSYDSIMEKFAYARVTKENELRSLTARQAAFTEYFGKLCENVGEKS